MTNEEKIWNYLYAELKNPYGTAGLMGNLFAESSLNPILANNIKKQGITSEQYTQIVDEGKNDNFITDGIAYGLAQWCFHTRKKGLLEKARAQKRSVGDLYVQLEYLIEEIKKYTTVYKVLLDARTIREASDTVLVKYEKPANQSEAVKAKRASYAEKYFQKYNATGQIKIKKRFARELLRRLENPT